MLAVRRGEQLLVPRGNTELNYGDRLTLFGPKKHLGSIRDWPKPAILAYTRGQAG